MREPTCMEEQFGPLDDQQRCQQCDALRAEVEKEAADTVRVIFKCACEKVDLIKERDQARTEHGSVILEIRQLKAENDAAMRIVERDTGEISQLRAELKEALAKINGTGIEKKDSCL